MNLLSAGCAVCDGLFASIAPHVQSQISGGSKEFKSSLGPLARTIALRIVNAIAGNLFRESREFGWPLASRFNTKLL
jgi:hypothetical protein